MSEERDFTTGRLVEYCKACGQKVRDPLCGHSESWYAPDDPDLFEFRIAVSGAFMRDAKAFERVIDRQLQRLRKRIMEQREESLKEKVG